MTAPAAPGPLPAIATDEQGRLDADLPCQKCQYNLRTLATDALCPECGEPVAATVRAAGNRLPAQYWMGALYNGVRCLLAGLACFAGGFGLHFLGSGEGVIAGFSFFVVVGLMLTAMSVFYLAVPGPPGIRYGWTRGHHYVTVGMIVVLGVSLVGLLVGADKGPHVVWTVAIAGTGLIVGWFGSLTMLLWHGRWVGRWLGWPYLGACSLTLAVIVAALGVALFGMVVGELVVETTRGMISRSAWWRYGDWFWPIWLTAAMGVYFGGVALLIGFVVALRRALATSKRLAASTDAEAPAH